MATARAARCSPRWVHRHLPAVRSACALIRATRTAGPLIGAKIVLDPTRIGLVPEADA